MKTIIPEVIIILLIIIIAQVEDSDWMKSIASFGEYDKQFE